MEYKVSFMNLKEEFNKVNIKCIEGTCIIPDNILIIELKSLDKYIDLLLDLKAKNVFYSLHYYDEEEYFIDEDSVLDEYGEKVLNLVKDRISEYNNEMESFDFDTPYRINLYFIKDNIVYLFYMEDDWLEEYEVFTADREIETMIEDIEPELESILVQHQKDVENLGEELKNLILNDKEFKLCTNQSSRGAYTRQLINSSKFQKYRTFFESKTGHFSSRDLCDFIELLWKKLNAK
ncbi:hypothetical protein [Clostridium sardiniense]|uniref:hypothetical protein n=1 Tax=Clostridium sardiniense TaxID=29369 RepID=UPI00195A5706|nr:hypothetical protein [Clostridium sardiniense]MBM7836314.1 hypothetical protein [Clostridium sardiniense]